MDSEQIKASYLHTGNTSLDTTIKDLFAVDIRVLDAEAQRIFIRIRQAWERAGSLKIDCDQVERISALLDISAQVDDIRRQIRLNWAYLPKIPKKGMSVEQALSRMPQGLTHANPQVANKILNLAKNVPECERVLSDERFQGIEYGVFLFTTILSKTVNIQQCEDLLLDERFRNIECNVITLNTVLSKAKNLPECERVLGNERFQRIKIEHKYNVVTLNTVLSKTKDLAECEKVLTDEHFQGIEYNVVTLNTVLSKTKDLAECEKVLTDESFQGIKHDDYDVITLSTVLSKTKDPTERKRVLTDERFQKVEANNITVSILAKIVWEGEMEILLRYPHFDKVRGIWKTPLPAEDFGMADVVIDEEVTESMVEEGQDEPPYMGEIREIIKIEKIPFQRDYKIVKVLRRLFDRPSQAVNKAKLRECLMQAERMTSVLIHCLKEYEIVSPDFQQLLEDEGLGDDINRGFPSEEGHMVGSDPHPTKGAKFWRKEKKGGKREKDE